MKIKTLGIISAALLFTGCGGSLSSPVPGGKVAYETGSKKSYIVFSRPEFIGAALSNTIVEFNPETYGTKYVGTLGPQTKLVYKTNPGTHYFYMSGGENDDMLKMTTKASSEYYVHTAVGMGIMVGRFYFKPLRYQSLSVVESLQGKSCSNNMLNQYAFKQKKDETSSLTHLKKYHSSKYNIDIECRKGIVKRTKLAGTSLESLNEAKLIQPNEEAYKYYKENNPQYIKEIKEDFADWQRDEMSQTAVMPNDGKQL